MKRVVFFLLLAAVALGDPDGARLRGVVLDPAGAPLANARVTLQGAGGCCVVVPGHSFVATETDASGRFSLPRPPPGMEVVVAHADHPAAVAVADDGAVVAVPESAAIVIAGPVPQDVEVTVAQGLRRLGSMRTAGGVFRLGPLPRGEAVTLRVRSERHRPYQRRVLLADAETVVRIELDEGLALAGRVVDAGAGVVVRASQGETRESRATTAADGTFRLTGLRAGPVMLVLLADGKEPLVVRGRAAEFLEVRWDR